MLKLILGASLAFIGLIGTAAAADLPTKAPLMKAPIAPVFNWTGFYVGINGGGGWSSVTFTGDFPLTPNSFRGTGHSSSFVGGGQIGFNYQFAPNWVVGIEANVIGGKFDQTAAVTDQFGILRNLNSSLKTIWDVAGRLGYASNNWLVYGKGGYARTHLDLNQVTPAANPSFQGSSSNSVSGFVVGAGLDYGLTQNWIVGIEYNYFGFRLGDQLNLQVPGGIVGTLNFRSIEANVQTLTARVNYKF